MPISKDARTLGLPRSSVPWRSNDVPWRVEIILIYAARQTFGDALVEKSRKFGLPY